MNTDLPSDIVEFADAALGTFTDLGGVDLARAAEADRTARKTAQSALLQLGISDLDVRGDITELLAGAVICRAAGATALPWPVVEQLLARDGARLALIDAGDPRVDHGDLDNDWLGIDLDGRAYDLQLRAPGRPAKLGPFLVAGTALPRTGGTGDTAAAGGTGDTAAEGGTGDVVLHCVLSSWRILGALETCLAQVVEHVLAREQFGKPLAEFQTVRFAVADASVAVRGLEELAKYTTWRTSVAAPSRQLVDALSLRIYAVERAVEVLRTSHQLLGALGFCDEHDVSVIDRHLQPVLRLPAGPESLAQRLLPAVRSGDFETTSS